MQKWWIFSEKDKSKADPVQIAGHPASLWRPSRGPGGANETGRCQEDLKQPITSDGVGCVVQSRPDTAWYLPIYDPSVCHNFLGIKPDVKWGQVSGRARFLWLLWPLCDRNCTAMTGSHIQTNGASLEDCHANFFALVRPWEGPLSAPKLWPFGPPKGSGQCPFPLIGCENRLDNSSSLSRWAKYPVVLQGQGLKLFSCLIGISDQSGSTNRSQSCTIWF